MNIPIIKGTSCPSSDEIAKLAIVITSLFPHEYAPLEVGLIGRIDRSDGTFGALVRVDDPFGYQGVLVGNPREGKLLRQHRIMVANGSAPSLFVRPRIVYVLATWAPKQIDAVRAAMIPAWDAREQLAKSTGSVAVADTLPTGIR